MKRIYLIDCPGVVPPNQNDSEEDILLRGVVRVENVENPAQYIGAVLRRTQARHLERTYDIKASDVNKDPIEFLNILARKGGRLLRGGEPDVNGVAKMVLNDFLRGKIPWFTPLPRQETDSVDAAKDEEVVSGRKGRLGEMPGNTTSVAITEDEGPALEEAGETHRLPEASLVDDWIEDEDSSDVEGGAVVAENGEESEEA